MPTGIDDIIAKANSYLDQVKTKAYCHFLMSENAGRKNVILGIFVTLFSSVVGTAIFTAISKGSTVFWIQVTTGFMSIAAAVLAAFQTFFHFNEISQKHKIAATDYDKVLHMLDIFLLSFLPASDQRDKALAELKSIVEELQKVEESSPSVPDSVYNRVMRKKMSSTGRNK
ncbi:MAG TPA: SLATT domain-containing protein [Puia sp.]